MPGRRLDFDELATLWESVQRQEGLDGAARRLPERGDLKPVRAAVRIFDCLRQYAEDGHPIVVLTPAKEVPPELRRQGILPVSEMAKRAKATGYDLREPTVFRLMAIHNHLTVLRRGTLPSPEGAAPPIEATYPPGHVGTLMRVRDSLYLSLRDPWYVLTAGFNGPAEPVRQDVQEEENLSMAMLRQHTEGHSFWEALSAWEGKKQDYEAHGRQLVREVEAYALSETGMEPAYASGGESYSPQDPPKILKWFIIGPMDYLLKVQDGISIDQARWKFRTIPFEHSDIDNWKLEVGYGDHLQTAAFGPKDQVENAREVQRKIIRQLMEPSGIASLVKDFETCDQAKEEVRAAKEQLTETILSQGTCWACPNG